MTLLNTTLLSICMSSLFAPSAFYTFRGMATSPQSMSIHNSQFSKSFPNIFQSFTPSIDMRVFNSVFSHILSSAISFHEKTWGEQCSLGPGKLPTDNGVVPIPIKNMTFGEGQWWEEGSNAWNDHHIYFITEVCGDTIIIAGCTFKSCYVTLKGTEEYDTFNPDETGGGALFVNYTQVSVTVHETIFDDCTTGSKRGAALLISGGCRPQHDDDDGSFEDYLAHYIDIQFCCFQNCYGYNTKIYGSAAFLGGKTTLLYFASTINCSDTKLLEGAQFDIQADNVTSKNVNITGGQAQFCSGMQIRKADNGFFKFQTIFGTKGSYITSYSDISITGDMMSHCNLVNNTLSQYTDDNPGLIHAIGNSIEVSYFYFANNTLNGGYYATRPNDLADIRITLSNCFSDDGEGSKLNYVTFNNCSFNISDITTLELDQLSLGSCRGNRKPDALLYSATWTPTESFTRSSSFTQSSVFEDSNEFSRSFQFTTSAAFMPSNIFTHSISFTSSTDFSPSASYTESQQFSPSASYTESTEFSPSASYTESVQFSPSASYTESVQFSPSASYTESQQFSPSASYTESVEFSSSEPYTESQQFLATLTYTESAEFSSSAAYTESVQFSPSASYTESTEFSPSAAYTKSAQFLATLTYTASTQFSSSATYTESAQFSPSASYTESTEFSPSASYTKSVQFSSSEPYTQSTQFTQSASYTESNKFSSSAPYTSSQQFIATPSYTESQLFTQSASYTESTQFTQSASYTESVQFSSSAAYTESQQFSSSATYTESKYFTPSPSFTQSTKFTSSISFTDSHHFSISNQFTNSNSFLPSRTYTPSQSFTPSILFSSSNRFTFSDTFSLSNHFTSSGIFTSSESFSEPIYFLRQSTKNAKEISKGAIAGICVIFIAANLYIILTAVSAYKLRKERKEYLRAMNEEEDIFENDEEEEYYYSEEEEEEAESASYYDSNYSSYYSGSYEASGSYGTSGSNEYSGSYGSTYNYSYSGA